MKTINKHHIIIGSANFPDKQVIRKEFCDGNLFYDKVLEGIVCNKCNYYDGVKWIIYN